MSGATLTRINLPIHYDEDVAVIKTFLEKYSFVATQDDANASSSDGNAVNAGDVVLKYMVQLEKVSAKESQSVEVDLQDLKTEHAALVERIIQNTKRYEDLFYEAINSLLPTVVTNVGSIHVYSLTFKLTDTDEPIDVIVQQRLQLARQNQAAHPADDDQADLDPASVFPSKLLRRYAVYFKPPTGHKALSARDAKGGLMGQLISIRAMVTRVSDVKPYIMVATYTCSACNTEIFQEVLSEQFTPVSECPSQKCRSNNVKGELTLQTRGSRFSRFQEAKIQELTDQVPMGHIPRSMTVYLYHDTTRSMSAGDIVTISGVLLPKVYRGFRAIRAGLLTETYLEVMHVDLTKKQYSQYQPTEELTDAVNHLAVQDTTYDRLAQSIAPEIYGHEDVKKALLMLMIGGVTNLSRDGMKIRGNINVCLMGDPGVAKSQLLKWVSRIAPRGVYTTGKGSSGVGLTAAVIKDAVTGEMLLEGGSLVLADNGICCIDEFDKMEESDRTAIHEVMEQQTVSISKAGINTTLNARTSILAAANPAYSRYNASKSVSENINLPHALLSRFDLLFLMRDLSDHDHDLRMAEHILFVHRNSRQPTLEFEPIDANLMRHFIARARQFNPMAPPELVDFIVGAYVQKRNEAHDAQKKKNGDFIYTQPRTLLAILRMSQALCRLRFSNIIEESDVREALRLMDSSKKSMESEGEEYKRPRDPVLAYYNEIKKLAMERGASQLNIEDIRNRMRVTGGFDEETLTKTIANYESANVWAQVGQTLVMI